MCTKKLVYHHCSSSPLTLWSSHNVKAEPLYQIMHRLSFVWFFFFMFLSLSTCSNQLYTALSGFESHLLYHCVDSKSQDEYQNSHGHYMFIRNQCTHSLLFHFLSFCQISLNFHHLFTLNAPLSTLSPTTHTPFAISILIMPTLPFSELLPLIPVLRV